MKSKFKCNGKFKLSIEENAIFICVYTVFKVKPLSKLEEKWQKIFVFDARLTERKIFVPPLARSAPKIEESTI